MKKLAVILFMVAIICSVGFAESKDEIDFTKFNYRTVTSGYLSCGWDFSAGGGEFGINLLPQEKLFVLRNSIFVQGGGGNLKSTEQLNYGALEIGDKLIIGGRINGSGFIVRSYGFTGCSFGLFACEGHVFFSSPFMIKLSFGGGFEFQFAENTAFSIEFGGIYRFLTEKNTSNFGDFSKSTPVLTIGYRIFI